MVAFFQVFNDFFQFFFLNLDKNSPLFRMSIKGESILDENKRQHLRCCKYGGRSLMV